MPCPSIYLILGQCSHSLKTLPLRFIFFLHLSPSVITWAAYIIILGFPGDSVVIIHLPIPPSARIVGSVCWSGRSLEKEAAAHSSVLARKSCGQRHLAGCSPWGCRVGHGLLSKQQQWAFNVHINPLIKHHKTNFHCLFKLNMLTSSKIKLVNFLAKIQLWNHSQK